MYSELLCAFKDGERTFNSDRDTCNLWIPTGFNLPDKQVAPRIYPNPASGPVTIDSSVSGVWTVHISDLSGRILYSAEITGYPHKIDISSFRRGVYLIMIRTKDRAANEKIIRL